MKAIIIGAGNHAQAVLEIISLNKEFEVIGFTDINSKLHGNTIKGVDVLGDDSILQDLYNNGVKYAFNGIGNSNMGLRSRIYRNLENIGFKLENVIHSSSYISKSVELGKGNIIFPGVIINSYSKIGNNCVIYSGSILEHNNVIENNVYISPGVKTGGNVAIRNGAFIGIGSTILPEINIGKKATIGAGAVVTKDINEQKTAIGIPAEIKVNHNE